MKEFEDLNGHVYAPGHQPTLLEQWLASLSQIDPMVVALALALVCGGFISLTLVRSLLSRRGSYHRTLQNEIDRDAIEEARRETLKRMRHARAVHSGAAHSGNEVSLPTRRRRLKPSIPSSRPG